MLFTNKATPTRIGKATLDGKGTRLFIPNGLASGVDFLTLSLITGGFAASAGLIAGNLAGEADALLAVSVLDWAKIAVVIMFDPVPMSIAK